MEINVHVGGKPGIDCGGFCEFCFYRTVEFNRLHSLALGCAYCPPYQIGCDYCRKSVTRVENNFKPLNEIFKDIGQSLMLLGLTGKLNYDDLRVTISGGADAFYYPSLTELVRILKESGITIHLGYVSGKGIKEISQALDLIKLGMDEVSFSIFSTDPSLREKWMHDKYPEKAIKSFELFCQSCDVNASSVVIPGINDKEHILKTAEDLEEWGVKSYILRRFANTKKEGLILNKDGKLIPKITTHSYQEFQELVHYISQEFPFKVYGLPYYDPKNGSPFAILKDKNRKYLETLPPISSDATIITGILAFPFIREFINTVSGSDLVNIVVVNQEIADLITRDDLRGVNTDEIKTNVIIPGGALVHELQVLEIFGHDKNVIRGPHVLTNHSAQLDEKKLMENEYKSFEELIHKINQGV
ncbi:MAG: methyl coenzyme M reductase-arginine methyltransferase Mmp10 [Methanobacterium sp.]